MIAIFGIFRGEYDTLFSFYLLGTTLFTLAASILGLLGIKKQKLLRISFFIALLALLPSVIFVCVGNVSNFTIYSFIAIPPFVIVVFLRELALRRKSKQ